MKTLLFIVFFFGPVQTFDYRNQAFFSLRFMEGSDFTAPSKREVTLWLWLNESAAGQMRRALKGRILGGKVLNIRTYPVSTDVLKEGDYLFVGAENSQDYEWESPKIEKKKVAVIGEQEGMTQKGSVFNIVRHGSRLIFEVSPNAAEKVGLVISPQLISKGTVIK